jgi:hypothetical protein
VAYGCETGWRTGMLGLIAAVKGESDANRGLGLSSTTWLSVHRSSI